MRTSLKVSKTRLLGCAVALCLLTPLASAQAKSLSMLYAFEGGSDGSDPNANLMMDSAGKLYGTTVGGGGTGDNGTVFELAPDGTETVLHSFVGRPDDGGWPYFGVIADKKGNLYGTTEIGGTSDRGTVYKLTPDGGEKVLYSFQGGADGKLPLSGLVRDAAGNLYGTTFEGGRSNCFAGSGCGTVYKLAPDGRETVLYAFQGNPDGEVPFGAVVMDGTGNLYGTTNSGGTTGTGTVFKVAPDGTETILYSFKGSPDGVYPSSGVIADNDGNLYGTTTLGGANDGGTIFEVAPDGTETVLYSFGGYGTVDGDGPVGGVIRDGSGNLFGTTHEGGTHNRGTVFELTPDGTETVLYNFGCHKNGGCSPQSALIEDQSGNLYGTASRGGPVACANESKGCGTVFKIRK